MLTCNQLDMPNWFSGNGFAKTMAHGAGGGRWRMAMTLKDLAVGESGRVLAVGGEKALRRRLLEMGITPRTAVTVIKAAPLGDPIELLLRGYVLSIRLEDAEKITIGEPEKAAAEEAAT